MVRCKKLYGEELPLPLVLSDPIVLEINHLQNQFKEKVKEIITCQNEIKAFKATESLKDKAIEKLRNEASNLDERLRVTEDHLTRKNLEIKKLRDEKKEALAAQYAAEATLRRVHANQKNEDGATANISCDYQRQISELQAEMRRLKAKLSISERSVKAELRLKEKLKVRLKELEKGLDEIHVDTDMSLNQFNDESKAAENENIVDLDEEDLQSKKPNDSGSNDLVSGFLYDRLQKEVIKLRKSCETKDISLQDKDEEIKMLVKKVDALTKAMKIAAREKETSSIKSPIDNMKNINTNSYKRAMKER